jgi:hypothetical protein
MLWKIDFALNFYNTRTSSCSILRFPPSLASFIFWIARATLSLEELALRRDDMMTMLL